MNDSDPNKSADSLEREFTLQFVFDRTQIDRVKLEIEIPRVLYEFSNLSIRVGLTSREHPLLLISSKSLSDMDKSHQVLLKQFIQKLDLRFFRLIDDAGDEFRKQAYEVLSEIEQTLRAFINLSIVDIDILGFEWWRAFGEAQISELQPALDKQKRFGGNLHPLEWTTFEELLQIVTTSISEWNEQHSLSPSDLLVLLENSIDIGDLKNKLNQKLQRFSFWDNIFAPYFRASEEEWKNFKSDLDVIIQQRNKVMHHRPFFYSDLQLLSKKAEKLKELLATRRDLSEQEQESIRKRLDLQQLRVTYGAMILEAAGKKLFYQMIDKLYGATEIDEVLKEFDTIKSLKAAANLNEYQELELLVYAFRTLSKLTSDNLAQAEDIILNQLLPICLRDSEALRTPLGHLRDCLEEWLYQYSEINAFRDRIVDVVVAQLTSTNSNILAACWTASHIGYRREDLVQQLWEIVNSNNSVIGDSALHTLIGLGAGLYERDRLLEELHNRAKNRFGTILAFSLGKLGSPSSLAVILENWFTGEMLEADTFDALIALTAVGHILFQNIEAHELHANTLLKLVELTSSKQELLIRNFYFSNPATKFNTDQLVPTLLSWLVTETGEENFTAWQRHLVELRLEESVLPQQLAGWKTSIPDSLIKVLKQDACTDTKHDLFAATTEGSIKEKTWETLFCLGIPEIFDWFEEAVVSETSRFMQQHIMEMFACLSVKSLPPQIHQWVCASIDLKDAGSDGRVHAQPFAATQVARSAATFEAFESLLNFGFTHDGRPLTNSTNALGAVAVHLVQQNEGVRVVQTLVDAIVNKSKPEYQRIAAAQTLAQIAQRDSEYLYGFLDQLLLVISDDNRSPLEKSSLITILSTLDKWDIPIEMLDRLALWAEEGSSWVGGSSLEVLIRRDRIERYPKLLNETLSLNKTPEGWEFTTGTELADWLPYYIGMLYNMSPAPYLPAIISLLKKARWDAVTQILPWVQLVSQNDGTSNEIVEAIIDRIQSHFSPNYSEPGILNTLAIVGTQRLLSQSWETEWNTWHHDARASLANVLPTISLDSSNFNRRVEILLSLAQDSHYQVRRVAYRSLSELSPDSLFRLCAAWSGRQVDKELQKRAAEILGWLPAILESYEEVRNNLLYSPDPSVREVATKALEEKLYRQFAKDYLELVMSVKEANTRNEDVLHAWPYAEALSRLADDEIIIALEKHLANEKLPPNVQYWIKRILKKTYKQWEKTTKDWPQPWLSWEGVIEEGNGYLEVKGAQIEVAYSIWDKPAREPGEIGQWGGMLSGDLPGDPDFGILEFSNGLKAQVDFTQLFIKFSDESIAIFKGYGERPRQ